MTCSQAKSLFSPYFDGAVTGKQMRAVSEHLENCSVCRQQYTSLRQVQQLLLNVGRRRASADLALKLRLAISREAALSRGRYWQTLNVHFRNIVDAFMVPATAGLASAVITFGLLLGFFALPLKANNPDVPLVFYTAPRLERSAFGSEVDSIKGDFLVIEAYVDANGRVEDYRVLSNPETKDIPPEVKNMLIFTTFQPATTMGRPTAGTAVLSFSKVSVKG
jgi:Putative zinc-finger